MNFEEILSLLKRAETAEQIDEHREDIARYIPEVRVMFDYDQKNHAHQYDLWMHCLHTVVGLPRNLEDDMLYLAAMIHDIGKPWCQVKGKRENDPNMHYYGHPAKSLEVARDKVIPQMEASGVPLSKDDKRRLLYYVAYHDDRVTLQKEHLRKHLNIPVTLEEFQKLMLLEVADAKAHVQLPIIKERVEICTKLAGDYSRELQKEILEEK